MLFSEVCVTVGRALITTHHPSEQVDGAPVGCAEALRPGGKQHLLFRQLLRSSDRVGKCMIQLGSAEKMRVKQNKASE